MKRSILSTAILNAVLLAAAANGQTPLGPEFTYQGRVHLSGTPLNSTADFRFRLYDAAEGGIQSTGQPALNNVVVVDGFFTGQLNFGQSAFLGDARWLEIDVRSPAGSGTFSTLSPRQQITATPYARYAPNAGNAVSAPWSGLSGVPAGFADGIDNGSGDGHSLDAADGSPIDALFVDNIGNVGIGTTVPQVKLHVATSGEGMRIQGSSATPANVSYLSFSNSASAPMGYVGDGSTLDSAMFLSADTGDVVLNTLAGRVVNVKPNGHVGIGTGSPNSALHVKGNGNILSLEGSDHFLMGFYPDGVAAGRKGYLGYVSPANNDLHFVSEAVGSSLVFVPGTSGSIYVGNSATPAPLVFPNVMGSKISLWGGASGDHYGLGIQSGALQIYSNGPGANVSFGHGSSASFVEHMRIAGNGRVGIGTTSPQQMLDVNGTARVQVLEITGADLAEKFPTSDKVEPGMVVAIDPANAGKLCLARGAYNRCVAGVVSGANDFAAGAVLGNLPGNEDAPPIALSGRVYVWCDAATGAITSGDMLTTSDTPGHAMKAIDANRLTGSVIGKAMTSLESGRGMVLCLVRPQ